MRWIALVLAAVFAIPLILLGPHGSVVAFKTAMFVPEIFPDAPIQPLRWITSASNVERSTIPYPGGNARLDVYVPAHEGRHAAVILMLGARPIDQDDPVITRFADGLSRMGIVVMVPASDGLSTGAISPDEIDLLVRELILLRERPDVDKSRVGYIGLSVGASLSLVAAADARIRDDVRFVNAFGGYFDVRDLFVALSSRSLNYAGETSDWEPAPLAREVMIENVALGLPSDGERECVRKVSESTDSTDWCESVPLSPMGEDALALLDEPDTGRAQQLVKVLTAPSMKRLDAISPRSVVAEIKADVLVMHDVNDRYIPYTESRRLIAALPESRLRAWTELELFDHVMPGHGLDPATFSREVAELFRHVYLTFMEIL